MYVLGYGDNYDGNPPICGQCQLGCIDGPLVLTPEDVTCEQCLVQIDRALELGAFQWRKFGRRSFGAGGTLIMTIPADVSALTRVVFEAQAAVLNSMANPYRPAADPSRRG